MNTKDFLQFVASGQASKAQEVLSDMLSQKAFEALDIKKHQIAQTLYNDGEDIEVQDTADTEIEEDDLLTQEEFDSLSEEEQQMYFEAIEQLDELSKTTLRNYLKGSRQENQGGLGSAGHMSDKARSLGRTDQDKEDGRYEGAKRAKRKLSEEAEQLDELSKTTLRNYLKGSRAENQGSLGSAGRMSNKARSLGRTDQDKEDGRYEGAKRAKRK